MAHFQRSEGGALNCRCEVGHATCFAEALEDGFSCIQRTTTRLVNVAPQNLMGQCIFGESGYVAEE